MSQNSYASPFELHVEQLGSTAFLRLSGEFDFGCQKQFTESIDGLALDRVSEIVLDLSEVSFIDSSGIRMALKARSRFRRDGFDLGVLLGDGQVKRAFGITGLNKVLRIIEA